MFSRILVKLIDQAIVPAILLIATRVVSIVLISQHYGYEFGISWSGFSFNNTEEYVKVNSYSMLSMIIVLTLFLVYVLVKSYIFHDSHIKPGLTAKLFALNAQYFIQDSFEIYTQGAIWVSYLYLLTIVSGAMAFFSILYIWVFYVSIALTLISTILFIFDIEDEMAIFKKERTDINLLSRRGF